MICAISPSSDNYEESLSTLRYADQAKRIRNKAMKNRIEGGGELNFEQALEENKRLREELMQLQTQVR